MHINRHLLFSAFILLVSSMSLSAASGPKNGTILIIRHGEKDDPTPPGDIGLNATGQQRAQKYVAYFTTHTVKGQSIKPDVIFASAKSKNSDRPRLTVQPLASALKESINQTYDDDDVKGLAAGLQSGPYQNKTVLVCWHHEKIGKLLEHLGADPVQLLGKKKWPDEVFGWLVILHYDGSGSLAASRVVNEKLMADDTIAAPR